MKYLGVDWGRSKIGLALAGGEVRMASPILTFAYRGREEAIEKIKKVVTEEAIDMIVCGKPTSLAGEEHFKKDFLDFIEVLKSFGLPVELIDERLSTKLAGKLHREFGQDHKV
ncbi:MAG: Holliday junction resolvase RuvX, partial [Parcubacteria group bacterium]